MRYSYRNKYAKFLQGTSLFIILVFSDLLPAEDKAYRSAASATVYLYEPLDLTFTGGSHANPYVDVSFSAMFQGPSGISFSLEGFWDGNQTWKLRVAPTAEGIWIYSTSSNDPLLDGLTGSFFCEASASHGFITHSGFGFQYTDGTPFFRLGDTCYRIFRSRNAPYDSLFKPYIDARAAQGFNCVYGVLHTLGYPSINEGGSLWYNDSDLDRLQPGYFHWVDLRIEYMLQNGIVPGIILAWSQAVSDFSQLQIERYVRYVVARYAAYNLFWLVSAAYNSALTPDDYHYQALVIQSHDPYQHPISIVPSNAHSTAEHYSLFSPWIGFTSQHYDGTHEQLNSYAINDRLINLPVANDEFGYEGPTNPIDPFYYYNNRTEDDVRKAAWSIVMGGAYITYGNIWTYTGQEFIIRLDKLQTLGANYMGRLKEFFAGIEFASFNPDNGLVSGDNFCLARGDSEYIVYLPDGGEVDLDLSASALYYLVEWYDPKTAIRVDGGSVSGGGTVHFVSPFADDAVLNLIYDDTIPTVSITINTEPVDLFAVVDDDTFHTPMNFAWYPNDVHKLQALSTQSRSGVHYAFLSWSDGGAQIHNITVPDTNATFTAFYDTSGYYLLADFGAVPTSGQPPLNVQFYDSSEGTIEIWDWDFRDNTAHAHTSNPQHIYTEPGHYDVQLTITGPHGTDTEVKNQFINVVAESLDFCDDFFDGDISDWTINTDSWSVINGDLDGQISEDLALIFAPVQSVFDGILTVDCIAMGAGNPDAVRIIFSYQDEYHYRYLDMRESENVWQLCEVVDGLHYNKVIWGKSINSGQFYQVRIVISEIGHVSISLDGQFLFDYPFPANQIGKIGLGVLDGNARFDNYCFTGSTSSTPLAEFEAQPLQGYEPLTVSFTDASVGTVDVWSWDFGDGSTLASEQNPTHKYDTPGSYNITLYVSGPAGTDSVHKSDYIDVMERPPAPLTDFDADMLSGPYPLVVHFRDQSEGVIDDYQWDFGDGTSLSGLANPYHMYTSPGMYTVTLTTIGPGGSHQTTKTDYIQVLNDAAVSEVDCYDPLDIVLVGDVHNDPYWDVDLSATFSGPGGEILVLEGFWIGDNGWKLRFTPTNPGLWSFVASSNDTLMNAFSGELTGLASGSKGFWRAINYHFEYADGTDVFRMGDTCWRLFRSNNAPYDSLFKPYVDARASQGFNLIYGVIHTVQDPSINEGGSLWLNDIDFDRLQPAYFDWVDKRVEYMQQNGICSGIVFTWAQEFDLFSQAQFEQFVRYIVARYAAHNVVWTISGEYTETRTPQEYSYFGNLVNQLDPYNHPISIHPGGNISNSRDYTAFSSWLDYIMQQMWGEPDLINSMIIDDRPFGIPVCNDEFGYEGPKDPADPAYFPSNRSADEVRTVAWSIIAGGGYFTYGHIYTSTAKENIIRLDYLDTDGANYLKILQKFIIERRIPLPEMVPDNSLVLSDSCFCLYKTGSDYLAYQLSGDTITLDLSDTQNYLDVLWFDPKSGAEVAGNTITGGDTVEFISPFDHDAVLYLYASKTPLLTLDVFIEGPFLADSLKMTTALLDSVFLPTISPYTEDPDTISSVPKDIVDWVLVKVSDTPEGPPLVVQSALLRKGGRVISSDGRADFISFNGLQDGSYYVGIGHRNHISVQSKQAVTFSGGSISSFDFRTGIDKYYISISAKELTPGVWGICAGDASGDGHITSEDYSKWFQAKQNHADGYLDADFNMDGNIDQADYDMWLTNAMKGYSSF